MTLSKEFRGEFYGRWDQIDKDGTLATA